jgi:hypothetical protein
MIKAFCHSDDNRIQVEFDAEPFLNQATNDQIRAIDNGNGAGEGADAVAEFYRETNPDIKRMFEYCDVADEGFEVQILDLVAFGLWMLTNKPHLRPVDELINNAVEDLSPDLLRDYMKRMIGTLLIDEDHRVGDYLSKTLDDCHIAALKAVATSVLMNDAFYRE